MKALLEKALNVCEGAEVYYRELFSTSVAIKLGKMQSIESEKKSELSLRIVKDGNMGSAIATSLEDDTILERALVSLAHQKSEPVEFPNEDIVDVLCSSVEVKEITTEDLVKLAFEVSGRIKGKASDVDAGIEVVKTLKTVKILNSSGFDQEYEYTNVSLVMFTMDKQGFYSTNREYSGSMLPEIMDSHIDTMLKLHRLGEKPLVIGNEKMPVIFSGSVMGALMLRVLSGVNGGNITKEISPLREKLGNQVFSDKLTIRDDASLMFGCNSFSFDDEGSPARNTMLFEKGVLKSYLTSLGNAKKLGTDPTGNAIKRTLFSKEIEDAPAVFETNMIIEGTETISDQDMIKGIKRGLLITGVMGAHTGNINQGEFSLNISSGYLIENGELVGKVKGSMVAGNIYDLFREVEAVGTEYEVMRSIFYPMGYSPMVQFREVNIIGK